MSSPGKIPLDRTPDAFASRPISPGNLAPASKPATADDPDLSALPLHDLLAPSGDGLARLAIDPETVETDLARLVLGLMEFLRQLMELQAIRRMENGTLSAEEEDRLGETLMRAESAIHDMAGKFGLSPEDLALDLGPFGRTF